MANQSSIAAGTVVRGHIKAEGDLMVLGQIEGNITAKGSLEIGEGALLKSELEARRIVVRGAVSGSAHAEEAIVLEPGARVVGDLRASSVAIRPGALVRGHVQTGAGSRMASTPERAHSGARLQAERPAQAARGAAGQTREAPGARAGRPAAVARPTASEAKAERGAATRGQAGPGRESPRRPPPPVLPKTPSQAQKRAAPAQGSTPAAPPPVVPVLAKRVTKATRRSGAR